MERTCPTCGELFGTRDGTAVVEQRWCTKCGAPLWPHDGGLARGRVVAATAKKAPQQLELCDGGRFLVAWCMVFGLVGGYFGRIHWDPYAVLSLANRDWLFQVAFDGHERLLGALWIAGSAGLVFAASRVAAARDRSVPAVVVASGCLFFYVTVFLGLGIGYLAQLPAFRWFIPIGLVYLVPLIVAHRLRGTPLRALVLPANERRPSDGERSASSLARRAEGVLLLVLAHAVVGISLAAEVRQSDALAKWSPVHLGLVSLAGREVFSNRELTDLDRLLRGSGAVLVLACLGILGARWVDRSPPGERWARFGLILAAAFFVTGPRSLGHAVESELGAPIRAWYLFRSALMLLGLVLVATGRRRSSAGRTSTAPG